MPVKLAVMFKQQTNCPKTKSTFVLIGTAYYYRPSTDQLDAKIFISQAIKLRLMAQFIKNPRRESEQVELNGFPIREATFYVYLGDQ
ncbi:hypothetical protein KIN20_024773 [Parelaphostrongylus tenuis]|uniref:Uncharacterized protein n=1 Tax=Parelaphostrongylus tenuis TaxID=148309 RepID=A0AAD5QWH6_PARTN|nr:hypothetical protein KIN20_024773 [Parelaphostrongylus tenuis]